MDKEKRVLKRGGLSCEEAHSLETLIDCERAMVVFQNITGNRQQHLPSVTVNIVGLAGKEALSFLLE